MTEVIANPSFEQLRSLEDRFQVCTYERFPFAVSRGRGSWIFDTEDSAYLDFYGGHAVSATGHCHPEVVTALKKQAEELLFYSNVVYHATRAEAARSLVEKAPEELTQVFFVNSGSEANEAAIRIARKTTGREVIISFEGGFHGRTAAALSACGLPRYREMARPLVPGHMIVPFGKASSVEHLCAAGNVAAILLEPIQSMAGIIEADSSFYEELLHIANRHGVLLIYDEVQTGLGRTGSWFYAGRHGVVPHLITLGKALASGVPMAAVLMGHDIASQLARGDLGSTFGGGPLACAALCATLKVIENQHLITNAAFQGERLCRELSKIEWVESVQGRGLLLGIKTTVPAKMVQDTFLKKGILTGLSADPKVLRLLPPLVISDEEVQLFLDHAANLSRNFSAATLS